MNHCRAGWFAYCDGRRVPCYVQPWSEPRGTLVQLAEAKRFVSLEEVTW